MDDMEARIVRLEDRYNSMDKQVAVFNEIVKNTQESNDELCKTLGELQKTFSSVQLTLVNMQNEITRTADMTTEMKNKMTILEGKLTCTDEKSKVDFILYIKNNFFSIVAVIIVALHSLKVF